MRVQNIDADSLFAGTNLKVGMVVVSVNGQDCPTFDEGLALLKNAVGKVTVVCRVDSPSAVAPLLLPPDESSNHDAEPNSSVSIGKAIATCLQYISERGLTTELEDLAFKIIEMKQKMSSKPNEFEMKHFNQSHTKTLRTSYRKLKGDRSLKKMHQTSHVMTGLNVLPMRYITLKA